MIISHRYRFIFVAIPRTGSQSLRAALRPLLGPEDWEQAAWRVSKRLPVPSLAALEHGHVSVREAQMHLPQALWRDYFKFAVIRDPWDRFLSAARFTQGNQLLFRQRPNLCMALLLKNNAQLSSLHFRPQHTFLERADGSVGVDFVGRFERLAEDFATVCATIGLRQLTLPRLNAAPQMHHLVQPDAGLRAAVRCYYARDYERFDYDAPRDPGLRAPVAEDR